jgi:DNA-directed RNA polymerase specialized sigma24 family protein
VAKLMGVPQGTVKGRAHRVRRATAAPRRLRPRTAGPAPLHRMS